jgi:hypothetical protein
MDGWMVDYPVADHVICARCNAEVLHEVFKLRNQCPRRVVSNGRFAGKAHSEEVVAKDEKARIFQGLDKVIPDSRVGSERVDEHHEAARWMGRATHHKQRVQLFPEPRGETRDASSDLGAATT